MAFATTERPLSKHGTGVRDQTHAAAGLTPLRFAEEQVLFEPHTVASVLRGVVRSLEGSRRPSEPSA